MDSMTILVLAVGALVFIGIFVLFYIFSGSSLNVRERVRQQTAAEKASQRGVTWEDYQARVEKVFKPLGQLIPRSPEEMSRQERKLAQAGIRRKEAAVIFNGARIVVAAAALVIFAMTGLLYSKPFLFLAAAVVAGAVLPDLWLWGKISERKEKIQLSLPDVMDLSVVCVEAGLGMDQALMRIGQELRVTHPEISEELHLYNLEVNAGKTRAEGLRNLAARTDVEDLKALVAVLIQSDRFGTSIAQSLRISSDNLRTKRRQRAEEKAAKTTVKMIPPLVIFVFPAIFVVVAGPAIITIIKQFFPMLMGN